MKIFGSRAALLLVLLFSLPHDIVCGVDGHTAYEQELGKILHILLVPFNFHFLPSTHSDGIFCIVVAL